MMFEKVTSAVSRIMAATSKASFRISQLAPALGPRVELTAYACVFRRMALLEERSYGATLCALLAHGRQIRILALQDQALLRLSGTVERRVHGSTLFNRHDGFALAGNQQDRCISLRRGKSR